MSRGWKLVCVFFVAVVLGAWVFFRVDHLLSVAAEPSSSASKIEATLDAPVKMASAQTVPTTAASSSQSIQARVREAQPASSEKPSSERWPAGRDWVDFELNKERYAVAYGDVILGKPVQTDTPSRGRAEAPVPQPWPTREIPYSISPGLPRPERVKAALELFNTMTPVRFVPYSGQRDAILFEKGSEHCYSFLGKVGGVQPIFLSEGCGTNEIVHELMHALGFVHEHSRGDRDQYVQVHWENIDPKYEAQFAVVPDRWTTAYRDVAFDYSSILLYRPDTFAKAPGLVVLTSIGAKSVTPVNEGLSLGDVEKLRTLYAH
jgi:hypothetical protein